MWLKISAPQKKRIIKKMLDRFPCQYECQKMFSGYFPSIPNSSFIPFFFNVRDLNNYFSLQFYGESAERTDRRETEDRCFRRFQV